MDITGYANPISRWLEKCGCGDEHGGQTHQTVKGGNELRQRSHFYLQRDHCTDRAADQHTEQYHRKAEHIGRCQGGDHRDDHPNNAINISHTCRQRRRQAAQSHDETDAGEEVCEGR